MSDNFTFYNSKLCSKNHKVENKTKNLNPLLLILFFIFSLFHSSERHTKYPLGILKPRQILSYGQGPVFYGFRILVW